jgi:hypothetical protein
MRRENMKIIEKKDQEYECIRGFFFDRKIKAREHVRLPDDIGFALASVGKVIPLGIPDIAKYKAISNFSFQVGDKLIKVKIGEIVEVRKQDALKLMLKRYILPLNPEEVWCPYKEKKRDKQYILEDLKMGSGRTVKVPVEIPVEAEQPKKKPFITGWKR